MLAEVVNVIHGWSTLAVLLRLLLAMLAGTVVGAEREWRNKSAGIKTHVLVCLGSALTMIVGEYLFHAFPESSIDPSRVGAQVISGIGFLGVGTIIVTGRNSVRGLTTAAGLWVCACMGLAAGAGYVEATLLALACVAITYLLLGRLDSVISQNTRTFGLFIELERREDITQLLRTLHSWECEFSDFSAMRGEGGVGAAVTVSIRIPQSQRKQPFIESLQNLDFVVFVAEA